ncbi:hypothetical protein F5Y00DRAFT_231967 [Daldinia vernicosa]|uniref:uncharacterized protein n=1 Tax=Daldinia vernicosa TaxID=114800 RepID=UPI0020080005|nr:uncharacterized protein F5Y00DRAFT_231967 [Daldinia vernicosa]KAI0850747.1 hypothetical protein F5Y00DRAFT_231967 [Daldinia vernicosa]
MGVRALRRCEEGYWEKVIGFGFCFVFFCFVLFCFVLNCFHAEFWVWFLVLFLILFWRLDFWIFTNSALSIDSALLGGRSFEFTCFITLLFCFLSCRKSSGSLVAIF